MLVGERERTLVQVRENSPSEVPMFPCNPFRQPCRSSPSFGDKRHSHVHICRHHSGTGTGMKGPGRLLALRAARWLWQRSLPPGGWQRRWW
jgi:hypothetical protein